MHVLTTEITGKPGNSPPGVADCSFYSTNKERMQGVFGGLRRFTKLFFVKRTDGAISV
jgi:hypothetical protein